MRVEQPDHPPKWRSRDMETGVRGRGEKRRAEWSVRGEAADTPLRDRVLGLGVPVAGGGGPAGDDVASDRIPQPTEEDVPDAQPDDGRKSRREPPLKAQHQEQGERQGERAETDEAVGHPGFHLPSVCRGYVRRMHT